MSRTEDVQWRLRVASVACARVRRRMVTTFQSWVCLALAAAALAAVCGGLWVDWKLNWGKKKEQRGFDVMPPPPPDGEKDK